MSRIVGVVAERDSAQRTRWLQDMLAAARSDVLWSCRSESAEHATLGWCGWKAPRLLQDASLLVAFDGSIVNRDELAAGATEEAVVASLYRKVGFVEAVRRLNGEFAVAVYDAHANQLWLGRDRFGVKPLYYAMTPQGFAFASRLRALLTLPGMSRDVNRRFVALYAASHYRVMDNDPEQTPFAAIARLPAGQVLRYANDTVWKAVYWTLQDQPEWTLSEDDLAHRYRELLLEAVAGRFERARQPAFTLSGGLDSASVLACAVHLTGRKQPALSTIYDDATYDESPAMRDMAEAAASTWHPVQIGTPDVVALVREMLEFHDEPLPTATWLSHYLLCQRARALGFRSLFGGLGGDELNAGEYEYFPFFFADLQAMARGDQFEREVSQWMVYHDHPVFRKNLAVLDDGLSRLIDRASPGRCLPDERRLRRYTSVLQRDYFDLETFEPVMEHPFRSYLKNRTYQDLTRETLPCCLRTADEQATACGLEVVHPFLDHRVVEFMFRVPGSLKIHDGVTKQLLRQAMKGLLPEATRARVHKVGWNAPAHVWFAGAGRERLLDLVRSREFAERGIYHVDEVCRLIEEHARIVADHLPQENHMMFLWQLVNLELWFQQQDAGVTARAA